MSIKPILFNEDMVRAILDGRKTVTRRVVKPQPESFGKAYLYSGTICSINGLNKQAPYHMGDILYVRETWAKNGKYYYKADQKCKGCTKYGTCLPEETEAHITCELCEDKGGYWKWRPSIHMPKEAARIWLKVTNVRVERLQDITTDQIEAEGIKTEHLYRPLNGEEKIYAFSQLWASTVKEEDINRYGWEANPFVWVIEFERCEKPQEVSH